MLRKTGITALLALVCCALGIAAQTTSMQTLSIVLDPSESAQKETPLTLRKPSDIVRVDWVEMQSVSSQIPAAAPKPAHIYYSRTPNGGDISKYTRISTMETDNASVPFGAGVKRYIRFVPGKNNMSAGAYYCIIAYTENGVTYHSNYFELKVAGAGAPILKDPRGLMGAAKVIDDFTPAFSWNPVSGVPYYHIILSDEPIPLADVIEGGGVSLNLSVVWQAITPNTRITYGAPDPSNTITASPPPLSPGKEYSWMVLNNYGNHMAFSDGSAMDVPGVFRINGNVLKAPKVLSPARDTVIGGDRITFKWDNLDAGANSYLVNLFVNTTPDKLGVGQLGELNTNSAASMLVWETTVLRGSETNGMSVDLLNAEGTLTGGKYIWRVYALDSRGAATTDSTSKGVFNYRGVPSGNVTINTVETVGDIESKIGYVELRSEAVSGPMQTQLAFYTSSEGRMARNFPAGTYRVTAVKEGYNTQTVTFSIADGVTTSLNIYMKRPDAVIYGRVAGSDSAWVNLAKVTAVSEWGDTVTALTNGGGNFTLSCREADWTVTVEKAGYGIPRSGTVTLRRGDNFNFGTMYLAKNPNTLSGTVRNSGGVPVIGAKVRVLREGALIEELASTPHNGAYSFSLPSGTYTLTAEKPGFVMYSRSIDLTGSRNQDITIAESDVALVNGAVFGKSWNASRNAFEYAPIPLARVTFTSGSDIFTVTGDAVFGKFSLSVPGGRPFTVKSEAGGFVGGVSGSVTTERGITHAYFDTLQALAMIRGKVVDTAGANLTDIDVIVYDVSANRVAASAKSSNDGSFEVRNIPDGNYIINAGRSGYYLLPDREEFVRGFAVSSGKPEPSFASYTLTMGAGQKRIRWDVVGGYTGKGSIKVTSPLNKTIPFSTVSAGSVAAVLDAVGPGDYVIEAAAESDPTLLQLSYRKFSVPLDGASEFSNTVNFPLRYTPPDSVEVDGSGDISLGIVSIIPNMPQVDSLRLYYRSEGSAQYKNVSASNGYVFKLKPDRDGCDLQYYFRVNLSNGDVYGSAKQIFTSYVKPGVTAVSRISVEPGSSGDTLYMPSSYRASFAFKAFYSDLFIPFDEAVNIGNVAWSVSGPGASVSGSGRNAAFTTGSGSADVTLVAAFTPSPPYAMKIGRYNTIRIPVRITGSALDSVTVVRNGGSGPLSNTENANFRVEAFDKNRKSVMVSTQWSIVPESGGKIGSDGTFEPKQDFFGVARVYASAGSMTAEYKESGANLPGLNVNHVLKSKSAPDTASTHRGLKLAFAANSIPAGESVELRAVIHSTNSDLKNSINKGSGGFRMADTLAYDLEFSRVDRIDNAVGVIIDIPAHLRSEAAKNRDNFKIARWYPDSLKWIELPSSEVILGGTAVVAKLHRDGSDVSRKSLSKKSGAAVDPSAAASKLHASARYAVVAKSVSFSVGLTVSPNPFSPYIRPVKEYGKYMSRSDVPAGTCFRISVEAGESFVKSIEVQVYNATGKRVWAVEKLGSEVGETMVWWDGRTTHHKEDFYTYEQNRGRGRMCRNGRYFVTVIVTDMDNRQRRVMKPLVMMK